MHMTVDESLISVLLVMRPFEHIHHTAMSYLGGLEFLRLTSRFNGCDMFRTV